MKIPARVHLCVFAAAMTISLAAHSYPGERIVLDPTTGDYTVNYWNDESLGQIVFVPATKITPAVKSKFELSSAEKINYRYTVSSGLQSKQTLISIILDPVNSVVGTRDDSNMGLSADAMAVFKANKTALATPAGWNGTVSFGGPSHEDGSIRTGWWASVEHSTGLKPGGTVTGFGFSSYALPGLGIIQLRGAHPVLAFPDEGFGSDSAIKDEFYRLPDHVPLNAAVPTIAVPNPFDPAVTLERIQAHMHTWIAMQLLEATFSAQLDRSFQTAISAYRLNQPEVGKKQIQTMRVLIKKEQPDADKEDAGEDDERNKNQRALIDKLAARILDFDLKYVMKRMGGDKD